MKETLNHIVPSSITQMDYTTKIQYMLMTIFGALTSLVAFAPISTKPRILLVGLFFGITVGFWISHLISVTVKAIRKNNMRH